MKLLKYTITGILLLSAASLFPCGPFFETAVFSFLYTQKDKKSFLLGSPHFIKPSFLRKDLTIAYRYLLGNEKIKEITQEREPSSSEPALNQWQKARQNALGLSSSKSPEIKTYKYTQGGSYNSFVNCYDDAFQFAAKTLTKRVELYGIKSKEVLAWITGQDIVFSNCGGDVENIPTNLNYPQDHLLTFDREYQIAASYFYSGNFEKARISFKSIADNKNSPYFAISNYLITRNLVRQAFITKEEGFVKENLEEALSLSSVAIKNPDLKDLKNAFTNQISRIKFYLYPKDLTKELENTILTSPSLVDFTRYDFARLLEYNSVEARKDSSMADWILNFRSEPNTDNLDYALLKWRQTKSSPWFVSVITKITANHKDVNSILEEGRVFTKDKYAYLTVSYHRIRLLIEQSRMKAAETLLNEVLTSSLNASDKNLFLNYKIYFAKNEKEFLRSSYLIPIGLTYDDGIEEEFTPELEKTRKDPHFTKAFAKIWNEKIPIDTMLKVYQKEKVPNHLEQNFLFSIFARAVLLNRADITEQLIPTLRNYPFLKKEMDLFRTAQTKEEKEFVGILTLLRLPGIKPNVQFGYFRSNLSIIDDYRDNWWCAFSELKEEKDILFSRHPIFLYNRLSFISEKEDKQANEEWKTLSAKGTAPDYLSEKVIEFSKKYPDNTYLPEALHRAVKTTRFGCTGEKTSEYSKSAFRILHKKFPNSEWAKKTRIHF